MKQQKQQPQPRKPAEEKDRQKSEPGIGSSQGQDRGSSDINPSQGTQHGTGESIVGESTGAFKERP